MRRSSGTSVLGGIKIGKKKLFIRTVGLEHTRLMGRRCPTLAAPNVRIPVSAVTCRCACRLLQEAAAFVEAEPLSVLDFYVHESCQRQGVGKQLFEVKHSAAAALWRCTLTKPMD